MKLTSLSTVEFKSDSKLTVGFFKPLNQGQTPEGEFTSAHGPVRVCKSA
jgi:hypothetical protein